MASQVSPLPPWPVQLCWVPPASLNPPPPRSVVRDMWVTPKRGTTAVPEVHERRSRVALTVAWMATTLAIALFVPDIGKVIELIGGISAFFIFIFPGKSERWAGGERARRCQEHCCGEGWAAMVLALLWGCRDMLVGDAAMGPG